MNLSKVIIFILLLFVNYCSQHPIYRYKVSSLDETKCFYRGREIISTDIEDVTVIISFEDQVRDELIFNLSILNLSNKAVDVDPAKIFFEIQKTYPADYYGNEKVAYNSIDPEQKLISLNKQITNLNSAKQTTDMVNTFVCLADLVKEISELGEEKSPDELYAETVQDQERTQMIASQEMYYQNNLNYLIDTKYYWENLVLRRTTLYPNNEISEYVHFPLDENAREILICVPINDIEFSFKYSSRPLINKF